MFCDLCGKESGSKASDDYVNGTLTLKGNLARIFDICGYCEKRLIEVVRQKAWERP